MSLPPLSPVNVGSGPDKGDGDTIRNAFVETNANEASLLQDIGGDETTLASLQATVTALQAAVTALQGTVAATTTVAALPTGTPSGTVLVPIFDPLTGAASKTTWAALKASS